MESGSLTTALRERGLRVTSQRLVINHVLNEIGDHATAEDVLAAVADRLPGVALPTVYATLDLLEDLGAVRRIAVPGRPVMYDPRTQPHHHSICRECGRVEDLDVTVDIAPAVGAATAQGFEARHAEVLVAGLCAACAARN